MIMMIFFNIALIIIGNKKQSHNSQSKYIINYIENILKLCENSLQSMIGLTILWVD
jgi:hypothetical protein